MAKEAAAKSELLSQFETVKVTAKGLSLLTKLILKGESLSITRAVIGDGIPDGDAVTMTELVNEIPSHQTGGTGTSATVDLQCLSDADSQTAIMRIRVQNGDTAFSLREIGIMATDPDEGEILYAYTVDRSENAIPFPANTDGVNVSETIDIAFFVSNVSEINANITLPAEVTLAEFNAHIGNKNNPHNVTAAQLGIDTENIMRKAVQTVCAAFFEIAVTMSVEVDTESPGYRVAITGALAASPYFEISSDKVTYSTKSSYIVDVVGHKVYCKATNTGLYVDFCTEGSVPADALLTADLPRQSGQVVLGEID